MDESFLDQISQGDGGPSHFKWRNGKMGAISDMEGKGIIRFNECYIGENGLLMNHHTVYERPENCPIVCIGIAAQWLLWRKSRRNIYVYMKANMASAEDTQQLFERYTKMRFQHFRNKFCTDARTSNWGDSDWQRHFYKIIICSEKHKNKVSEALFDFILKSDVKQLRIIMENYIEFLEKRRAEYCQQPKAKLTGILDTELAREIFDKCIEKGWMHESESGYEWDGIPKIRGSVAQLAYMCGKIYGFKYSDKEGRNIGNEFPDPELCKLFNIVDLRKQLVQVYQAKNKQKWRAVIDKLFE